MFRLPRKRKRKWEKLRKIPCKFCGDDDASAASEAKLCYGSIGLGPTKKVSPGGSSGSVSVSSTCEGYRFSMVWFPAFRGRILTPLAGPRNLLCKVEEGGGRGRKKREICQRWRRFDAKLVVGRVVFGGCETGGRKRREGAS